MLALAVLVFIAIDLAILLVYTVVEGARGNLCAQRQPNSENLKTESGVRLLFVACIVLIYVFEHPVLLINFINSSFATMITLKYYCYCCRIARNFRGE